MKTEEENCDLNESFDEAMSPVNSAESSDSDETPQKSRIRASKEIFDTKLLLKYIKECPWMSTVDEDYCKRFLELYPEIGVSWQSVYEKVGRMRRQYVLTKKWLHENVADIDENEIEREVKLRCPHYYELDAVLEEKVFDVSKEAGGASEIAVEENGVKEEQFPAGVPDRKDDLTARRLQFEKRKLHFESMKFEEEKSLEAERLQFEGDVQQREMELRRYEIETKRMHVESVGEVQRLRLAKEERIKMLRIEMEAKKV
ncbi:uncharacterized protein LOC132255498 [Phlebotomus argentipes]|uniref:uncharacterized protein LOC132255498 n=1 Tax=Phlebotomus argentipes TaxID=94469 RepID=UPI00289326CC|nr:uncharacterized protein LOC132255498 [Phlebotomus argentipes]